MKVSPIADVTDASAASFRSGVRGSTARRRLTQLLPASLKRMSAGMASSRLTVRSHMARSSIATVLLGLLISGLTPEVSTATSAVQGT